MKKLLLIFPFLFMMLYLQAQNGIIRGKIIDAKTGEELLGANIILPGTEPLKGTITDFDGKYTIESIPVGTYNLVCSFISYEKKIIENVIVKENEVTILDISLGQAELDIEEVVITAKLIKRTEAALITLQRKSATVLDGISAQQISKLGDSDAAGALKRVTGISVQGGKYIYVRGLSDRYSKTTLNGAEIPGLDPNKNSVQMDLFPSNLIENMVVHKTFSPELPGSFTGGHVNLVTKDFPDQYTFKFSTSIGYNPQANLNNNFLTYKGGKLDWLGFDDGTRTLPNAAKGQLPYRYINDDRLSEVSKSFNTNMTPIREKSLLNNSHSISIGNQIDFLGKKLGFIAGLTYSRSYKYYNDGFVGRYKLNDRNSETLGTELFFDTDHKGTTEVLWGAMINGNLKLNNNNKIGLVLIKNQSGESTARYLDGMKISDDPEMHFETRTIQYLERSFTSGQLKGEHILPINKTKIDWLSSYTTSIQDEPDLRYFSNSYKYRDGKPDYYISTSKYPEPTRNYRYMKETNLDNKVNIEVPFNFGKHKSKFKFGGAYVFKERDFDTRKISFNENSDTYEGNISEYFNENNMWFDSGSSNGIYVTNSETSDNTNSYNGKQSIYAAYAMLDIPFEKIRLMLGARIENTDIKTESLNKSLEKGKLNNTDVLPSLNLTYNVTESMNVRFAASRTLARPSFRELAPFASFDFVGDYIFVGNASLKRTLIDNFDFRWEKFMKPGELISASVFVKNFHDPIERTFNTQAANPELTLRNVNKASLYGIEFEFRKKLDFVEIFNNFSLGGNFTFVKSEVSVDEQELAIKKSQKSDFKDTRVMYGQAPYIINAYLNYTNDSIGLSSNLSFNTTGKQLYLINATGVPDIYQMPKPQLDFNISKKFGKRVSVKFSVKNLLNSKTKRTYEFKGTEYIYSEYSLGRAYSIGFSYSIN